MKTSELEGTVEMIGGWVRVDLEDEEDEEGCCVSSFSSSLSDAYDERRLCITRVLRAGEATCGRWIRLSHVARVSCDAVHALPGHD